jgi:AsmA protein
MFRPVFSTEKLISVGTDLILDTRQLTTGRLVKNNRLSEPYIKNINLTATVKNTDGTFSSSGVQLAPFKFNFEGNPLFVDADSQNFEDLLYKVRAKGVLNVGRIIRCAV